jgi:hypothetical protein
MNGGLERVLEGGYGVRELAVGELFLGCAHELRVRLQLHRLRCTVEPDPAEKARRPLNVHPRHRCHDAERDGGERKREGAPAVASQPRHARGNGRRRPRAGPDR